MSSWQPAVPRRALHAALALACTATSWAAGPVFDFSPQQAGRPRAAKNPEAVENAGWPLKADVAMAPQAERRTMFAPDPVGTAEQILQALRADPSLARVGAMRLELPCNFALDDHAQILADTARPIAPALGWRASCGAATDLRNASLGRACLPAGVGSATSKGAADVGVA
jgi:hypothetical protein